MHHVCNSFFQISKKQVFAVLNGFPKPILILNSAGIADEPWWNNSITGWIEDRLANDLLSRGLVGMLIGIIGIYVFLLVSKVRIKDEDEKKLEHVFGNHRTVVGLTAFLSFLIPVGIFLTEAPKIIAWTIRSALLLSGFVVGGFAASLGILFGNSKSAMLIFVGSILSFILAFFLGLLMISFAGGPTDLVFISQTAFFMNTIMLTGIVAYMTNFDEHVYSKLASKLF